MKKNCQYKNNLSAFLDGELSPQNARQISAHLEDCEGCREALKLLQNTDRLVLGLESKLALSQTCYLSCAWRYPLSKEGEV